MVSALKHCLHLEPCKSISIGIKKFKETLCGKRSLLDGVWCKDPEVRFNGLPIKCDLAASGGRLVQGVRSTFGHAAPREATNAR